MEEIEKMKEKDMYCPHCGNKAYLITKDGSIVPYSGKALKEAVERGLLK